MHSHQDAEKFAGRVQSVALRLLCAREAEIEALEPEAYGIVESAAMAERGGNFTARLMRLGAEAAVQALERINRQLKNPQIVADLAGLVGFLSYWRRGLGVAVRSGRVWGCAALLAGIMSTPRRAAWADGPGCRRRR